MENISEKMPPPENDGNDPVFIDNKPSLFLDFFFSENNSGYAEERIKPTQWRVMVLFATLLIFGIWAAIPESSEHLMKRLISEGQYRECTMLSDKILSRNSDNRLIRELAAEALVKDIFHRGWSDKLDKGNFDYAKTILIQAAELSRNNPEGLKAVNVLKWISELEEYFFQREFQKPLVIFRDENRIKFLLRQFERDKEHIRNFLGSLISYSSEDSWNKDIAEQIQDRVFRLSDRLYSQKLLYLGDVEDLKNTVLKKSEPEQLKKTIEEFKRKFPGIGGLENLSPAPSPKQRGEFSENKEGAER